MGEVYRATDTDLRRQVAIKVLLQPQMLPGGTALLMTIAKMADGPTRWDKAQIVVQKIATGQRTIIVNGGADARYVPTGHLTYAVGRQMMWRSLLQV